MPELGKTKLTGKQLEELFHAVVAREAIGRVFQGVQVVDLNALDHEGDVVGAPVSIKVCIGWMGEKRRGGGYRTRIGDYLGHSMRLSGEVSQCM